MEFDALDDRRSDVDASDFGWKAGQWPETVTYRGFTYTRQNPRLAPDGELLSVSYLAPSNLGGALLVVWND